MDTFDLIHANIHRLITQAERIILVAHVRPDGDAIGSILGLGSSLRKLGKDIQMVIPDGTSKAFQYLPGWQGIQKTIDHGFDISIILDCSDLTRIGTILGGTVPDINIDHHITNENFARINLVKPEAAATAEIISEFLISENYPIDVEAAQALLAGILIDTIGFRTTNVTPKTLRIAAQLMEAGADLANLYYKGIIQRSFEAISYWGKGLSKIQHNGNIVWTKLTLADRAESNYPGNDDADLVNLLSTIEPFPIAILFTEQSSDKVKVSWRAHPGWDVSQIALRFNGGGHAAAAGAEIAGKIDEVENQVLSVTKTYIESKQLNDKSLVGINKVENHIRSTGDK